MSSNISAIHEFCLLKRDSFVFVISRSFPQVIVYSGDRAFEHYYEPLKGRVHFNSPDPKNGDASMNIMGLKATDTGTYQCKVKKVPGISSRKILLTVMGEWKNITLSENGIYKLILTTNL